MAKGKLERQLAELNRLRTAELSAAVVLAVRAGLASKSSHVVAKAAFIATERELPGLEADLIAGFERFMRDPAKNDKGCGAKQRIVDALYALGSDAEAVFLQGVRHVQMEPVWGGEVDTAVELRAGSALALVRMGYHDVLTELVHLLADPAADARLGACRAITYGGSEAGALLLRFKALTGDEDSRVIGACFDGLLAIQPDSAFGLVVGFLRDADPAVVEAAALALGESRRLEALAPLRAAFGQSPLMTVRRALLLAIAMLRLDEALDYLLDLVREGPLVDAAEAVRALAIHLHDDDLRERVTAIVEQRDEAELRTALRDGSAPESR